MSAGDFAPLDLDDGRNWARRVACRYLANDYPSYAGYCVACGALGVEPKQPPEKPYRDRQQEAAADFATGDFEDECSPWV